VDCIFGRGKINAWLARGATARVSVNFRKFSPCIARARRAHAGLTVYPPSWKLDPLAFHGKNVDFVFFLRKWNKAMSKSVILLWPSIQ
jgi:hypothetical protein